MVPGVVCDIYMYISITSVYTWIRGYGVFCFRCTFFFFFFFLFFGLSIYIYVGFTWIVLVFGMDSGLFLGRELVVVAGG